MNAALCHDGWIWIPYQLDTLILLTWWRHQMEIFSALPAICAGNSSAPVNSPHKGQWRGALTFSLISAWINGWVNKCEASDLRRHRVHYYVTIMVWKQICYLEDKTNLYNHCEISDFLVSEIWWRNQMEIFSALLVICAGNSPGTGEFPAQRPVTWGFDVFFDLRLNERLSKQSWGWRFEMKSPRSGWLYVFSSFPPPQILSLTSKPFVPNLIYLGQRIYGSGEMYWMTFLDLDPRSRLWHWLTKICLSAR